MAWMASSNAGNLMGYPERKPNLCPSAVETSTSNSASSPREQKASIVPP